MIPTRYMQKFQGGRFLKFDFTPTSVSAFVLSENITVDNTAHPKCSEWEFPSVEQCKTVYYAIATQIPFNRIARLSHNPSTSVHIPSSDELTINLETGSTAGRLMFVTSNFVVKGEQVVFDKISQRERLVIATTGVKQVEIIAKE